MKVTLLKDVLTPNNGVGRVGQTVEMSAADGKQYISRGLATEAADDAVALPPDPPKSPAQPLTRDNLKDNKAAKSRETK